MSKWLAKEFSLGITTREQTTHWLDGLEHQYEVRQVVPVVNEKYVMLLAQVDERWDARMFQAQVEKVEEVVESRATAQEREEQQLKARARRAVRRAIEAECCEDHR